MVTGCSRMIHRGGNMSHSVATSRRVTAWRHDPLAHTLRTWWEGLPTSLTECVCIGGHIADGRRMDSLALMPYNVWCPVIYPILYCSRQKKTLVRLVIYSGGGLFRILVKPLAILTDMCSSFPSGHCRFPLSHCPTIKRYTVYSEVLTASLNKPQIYNGIENESWCFVKLTCWQVLRAIFVLVVSVLLPYKPQWNLNAQQTILVYKRHNAQFDWMWIVYVVCSCERIDVQMLR